MLIKQYRTSFLQMTEQIFLEQTGWCVMLTVTSCSTHAYQSCHWCQLINVLRWVRNNFFQWNRWLIRHTKAHVSAELCRMCNIALSQTKPLSFRGTDQSGLRETSVFCLSLSDWFILFRIFVRTYSLWIARWMFVPKHFDLRFIKHSYFWNRS